MALSAIRALYGALFFFLIATNAQAQGLSGTGVPPTVVCTGSQSIVSYGPGGGVCGNNAASGSVNNSATANPVGRYATSGTAISPSAILSDDGTNAYVAGPLDIKANPIVIEVANAGVTGTTNNKLASLTGAPSTAVITTAGATSGVVGCVSSGGGTTGSALIAVSGRVSCTFDNSTTAGDYVTISSSVNGDVHDAGATLPSGQQVLGQVLATGAGGATLMAISASGGQGATSGSVTSVNTTMPGALLSGSGCSYTTSGTCAISLVNQGSNQLFGAPANGSTGAPLFRAMVAADVPSNLVSYAKIQQVAAAKLLGNTSGSTANVAEIPLSARLGFVAGSLDIASGSVTNTYLSGTAASDNLGAPKGDLCGPTYAGGPTVCKINGVAVPATPNATDYTLITTSTTSASWEQAANCTYAGYSTAAHSFTCNTQPNLSLTVGNPCQQISASPIGITSGAVTINPFFAVQTTAKVASYTLVDSHSGGATDACSTIIFNGSNLTATINSSAASYFPTGYPVQIQNINATNLTVAIGTGSSVFYGAAAGNVTSFTLAQNCFAFIEADAAGSPNNFNVQAACPSGGGGGSGNFIKISTQTASNSATLDFTGLPASYNTLMLDCNSLIPATNNSSLNLRVGTLSTTWQASNYEWRTDEYLGSGTAGPTIAQNAADAQVLLSPADVDNVQGATKSGQHVVLWIRDVQVAHWQQMIWDENHIIGSGDIARTNGAAFYYGGPVAVTGLRVLYNSGNITSGQCTIYGLTP